MTRCVVGRIRLSPHPTRVDYEVGAVLGRQVVVGRHYADGQLGVYVPEGYALPEAVLREMWLWNEALGKGRLAGKKGDRVKARRMAGVLSEGLFYGGTWREERGELRRGLRWRDAWREGDDVTEEFLVERFTPP